MPSRFLRAGFTLIELSIVLLVIGLLVGGIMAGRELVRNSEMNSIIADINNFTGAYQSFKLKYVYAPGDLPDAYRSWPNAGCTDTASTTSNYGGCNGNGNGYIDRWYGGVNQAVENFRAWQELALSGILDVKVNGLPGSLSAAHAAGGQNAPVTKDGSGVYDLTAMAPGGASAVTSNAMFYDGDYGDGLLIGGVAATTSGNGSAVDPFLSPMDLTIIDQKMDDGRPAKGKLKSLKAPYNPGCATTTTSAAYYQSSSATIACSIIYTF